MENLTWLADLMIIQQGTKPSKDPKNGPCPAEMAKIAIKKALIAIPHKRVTIAAQGRTPGIFSRTRYRPALAVM
jgi:hypothetical protein